jgi:hypothetical protein
MVGDIKAYEGDGMSGGFNGDRCVIGRAVGHHGLIAFDDDVPNVAGTGTFVLAKI